MVGAGVAGLSAAQRLARAGLHVEVFEASDGVGGRARTDRVDGFLLDRGFQMLSTAYPAARRVLDLEALDLRRFDRATLLHVEGRRIRVGDPRREGAARGAPDPRRPIGGLRDKAALAAYAASTAIGPVRRLRTQHDMSVAGHWTRKVCPDPWWTVCSTVLQRVGLEEDMTTSSRFVDLMLRMFTRGSC